jgi:pilus assembly protein CpaE
MAVSQMNPGEHKHAGAEPLATNAVIACDDPSLLAKISVGLREAGIECPLSQHFSLESALAAVKAANGDSAPTIIFFGSQQFAPADFSLLKQLCADKGSHAKVVAVGPADSPTVVLQAIHNGAIDFLDMKGNLVTGIKELVSRLTVTAEERRADGRLFTVVGPAGGSGASLLAANLAAVLAQRQSACGLLDLHLRGGDLATMLKIKPRHTLLSLAGKGQQFDRAMFDQSLIKHESGIHLLASPEPFSNYRQISPQLIQQVVQFARASFPSVVVELEDMEHTEQVRTLAASDRIIIALRLDFVALCRTKLCIDHLSRANITRERITLVACRAGQPNELPMERFAEVLGLPVNHCIRHDPAAVNSAVNLGMPLVMASPHAKASSGIIRLADSLIGAVIEPSKPSRIRRTLTSAASLLGLVAT